MSLRCPLVGLLTAALWLGSVVRPCTADEPCRCSRQTDRNPSARSSCILKTGACALLGLPCGLTPPSLEAVDAAVRGLAVQVRCSCPCQAVLTGCCKAGSQCRAQLQQFAQAAVAVLEEEAQGSSPCPYLAGQAGKAKSAVVTMGAVGSVLDNLEKLTRARQMLQKADHQRQRGNLEKARATYAEVQRLCPGSSCDSVAAVHLQEMAAAAAEDSAVEEAEVPADEGCDEQARIGALLEKVRHAVEAGDLERAEHLMLKATWQLHKLRRQVPAPVFPEASAPRQPARRLSLTPVAEPEPCTALYRSSTTDATPAQVSELLQACHQAMQVGDYDRAQKLARRALALDPASVHADALVYKTHMLIQLQEKIMMQQGVHAIQHVQECWKQFWEDVPSSSRENQPHRLPCSTEECEAGAPLDVEIVEALKEVLQDIDTEVRPRLHLVIEEPKAGDTEESEESGQEQIPVLVLPATGDLVLDGADEECCDLPGVCSMLQAVFERVSEGACVDVDGATPGQMRVHCVLQLGPIQGQVRMGPDGFTAIIRSEGPAAEEEAEAGVDN